MSRPQNLRYTKEHEWIDTKSNLVGVTDFAVEQLGDIVHIDLPAVGKTFKAGDSFGTIESTKTVSDLYMPVSGKVLEVNPAVKSKPESLQTDAYQNGWLLKIEASNPKEFDSLLDVKAYDAFVSE
jgi:glycine cleavage system H protein